MILRTLFCTIFTCFLFIAHGQDMSWLQGRWIGDGFGGISEEVWSAPSADGTLMGMYRHMNENGTTNFYELFVLDSTGLRLRHFNEDFTAWEEKEKSLNFKMVAVTKNKVTLKGLIYESLNANEMKVSLEMNTDKGLKTEVFIFHRQK